VISRRGFLQRAAWFGAAAMAPRTPAYERNGALLAYVGTYSDRGGGIYLFRVDPSNGRLALVKVFPSAVNPTWLAFGPSNRFLYAANEVADFDGGSTGSVSAYAVDTSTGELTAVNTVTSGGAGPAHLSVDPLGQYVFVANYGGGSVAAIPIRSNGSLGAPTHVVSDVTACSPPCPVGAARAAYGPRGHVATSGHDAAHAHMVRMDPAGKQVIANDLGLDRTIVWGFDRASGTLLRHQSLESSPGAGPRHFAFHPNGRWLYSLNEEASTIAFMVYETAVNVLRIVDEVSTLPSGFAGTSFASEIAVSADGRVVYAANRLHDTIAIFRVGPTGRLTYVGETWTRGDYPRSFAIEPGGRYLYSCNHRGDSITIFAVGRGGLELTFTGLYVPVGSPACIVFLGRA